MELRGNVVARGSVVFLVDSNLEAYQVSHKSLRVSVRPSIMSCGACTLVSPRIMTLWCVDAVDALLLSVYGGMRGYHTNSDDAMSTRSGYPGNNSDVLRLLGTFSQQVSDGLLHLLGLNY